MRKDLDRRPGEARPTIKAKDPHKCPLCHTDHGSKAALKRHARAEHDCRSVEDLFGLAGATEFEINGQLVDGLVCLAHPHDYAELAIATGLVPPRSVAFRSRLGGWVLRDETPEAQPGQAVVIYDTELLEEIRSLYELDVAEFNGVNVIHSDSSDHSALLDEVARDLASPPDDWPFGGWRFLEDRLEEVLKALPWGHKEISRAKLLKARAHLLAEQNHEPPSERESWKDSSYEFELPDDEQGDSPER